MLSIIVAISQNNVIGCNNKLPWHIPEDLKRFKEITLNHTLIVGRKTFESLPGVLPKRKHIIISNNKDYKIDNENAVTKNNLTNVLKKYENTDEEVFIIGGANIYEQSLPYCKKLYITKIYKDLDGDAFFNPDYNGFSLEYESEINICKDNNLQFKYFNYAKIL